MPKDGYVLGLDIGSSSIKVSMLDSATGKLIASATSPENELQIISKRSGWAEQDPAVWWKHCSLALRKIKSKAGSKVRDIAAIGVTYQMHGLVLVDKKHRLLRPAIIWCDSRAVEIGEKAFSSMGKKKCLRRFLNSPGNFTASKLKWVQQNQLSLYKKIYKMMLPGDYIALKMTGEVCTTFSGLSEAILWDFSRNGLAHAMLDHLDISPELIPESVPSFSIQGSLKKGAADELGLKPGIPVAYRAGDQPNNAFSLNVLNPGEIAATAGTSGVVYGVGEKSVYDPLSRINTFVHVNHTRTVPRYGVLLCLNGAGILNSWLKHTIVSQRRTRKDAYEMMNSEAAEIAPGADGLFIFPYDNGAERTLCNRSLHAHIRGLEFSIHSSPHIYRAAQEGIVFALNYGLSIMQETGVKVKTVRAGHANMFLSPVFREIFASVTGAQVELYNTDGAQGAARGAAVGAGVCPGSEYAFTGLKTIMKIEPNPAMKKAYKEIYQRWKTTLDTMIRTMEERNG
jgi:xylulokinase